MDASGTKGDFEPQAGAKPVKDFESGIALAALDVADGMDGEIGQFREILLRNAYDLAALFEQRSYLCKKGSGLDVVH